MGGLSLVLIFRKSMPALLYVCVYRLVTCFASWRVPWETEAVGQERSGGAWSGGVQKLEVDTVEGLGRVPRPSYVYCACLLELGMSTAAL